MILEALPSWLFSAFILLSVVGCLCLVLIFGYWRSIGKRIGGLYPKAAVESIQFLAGAVSLGSTFAATLDKPAWFPPAWAGWLCLFVWKVVQLFVDDRLK